MDIKVNSDTPELSQFLRNVHEVREKYYKSDLPNSTVNFAGILEVNIGRRYISVWSYSTGRSIYCFIDRTNGDVLKAATWKAPAKHARGNIFANDYKDKLGPYGPAYLRG